MKTVEFLNFAAVVLKHDVQSVAKLAARSTPVKRTLTKLPDRKGRKTA